jgi:hypothetical protein
MSANSENPLSKPNGAFATRTQTAKLNIHAAMFAIDELTTEAEA